MASFLDIPVYECPVDGCDWQLSQFEYERNRPPLRVSVCSCADGNTHLDVSEALAANAKHINQLLRDHVETHDVVDWIKTIQRLNQDLSRALLDREHIADEIETPDSELCDCGREENPPIGRRIGRDVKGEPVYEHLAHHCECRAVLTSATIRRGKTMTLHERECCDHGYGEQYREVPRG